MFNALKQKKLIVNIVVNRNWKKLTDSRKRAKILADNRKSYHPIETLLFQNRSFKSSVLSGVPQASILGPPSSQVTLVVSAVNRRSVLPIDNFFLI